MRLSALLAVGIVTLLGMSRAVAQEREANNRALEEEMGCPGFAEGFRERMDQLLNARPPQDVTFHWAGRLDGDGRSLVETITINSRVYRVDHAVASCAELTEYLVRFAERDLAANPPVSVALILLPFADVGSTPAVTMGSRLGVQLDVDRFALIVHADLTLPQTGPIATGSSTTVSASVVRGGLLGCGRALARTPVQGVSLDLCGGFSAGAAVVWFSNGAGADAVPLFALGLSIVLRVPLLGPFDFLTAADLDVFVVRPERAAPPPSFVAVPVSEVVAGRLHVGLAVRL